MRVVWEAPERGGGWAAGDDAWRSLGCARSLLRAVAGHRIHGVAGVLQLIEPVSGPRCGSGCACSILEPSTARCPNHVVRGASLSSVQVPGPPGCFVLGDVATLRCAMAQFLAWPSRAGHGAAKKKRETLMPRFARWAQGLGILVGCRSASCSRFTLPGVGALECDSTRWLREISVPGKARTL